MRRIIVKNNTGRKTSCTARTRARGITKEQKRLAKLGRVGMFEFEFTLVKDNIKQKSAKIIEEKTIKTDSYSDAVLYAHYNTPVGHQGLIDGESVVIR